MSAVFVDSYATHGRVILSPEYGILVRFCWAALVGLPVRSRPVDDKKQADESESPNAQEGHYPKGYWPKDGIHSDRATARL